MIRASSLTVATLLSRRRRLPRWHVSWSRTVLSPAASPGHAAGGYPDRRGSSLVIIVSAHR